METCPVCSSLLDVHYYPEWKGKKNVMVYACTNNECPYYKEKFEDGKTNVRPLELIIWRRKRETMRWQENAPLN